MAFETIKPPCSQIETKAGCIQAALEIVGDKWSPLLIGQLVSGPKTFGELEGMLCGISPRTLSARLVKLEEQEILARDKYNERPPRFRYHLTEKGKELKSIITNMADWGEKYQ